MKISKIQVYIDPHSIDEKELNQVTASYDSSTGLWKIHGEIFSRHLKVLSAITNLCKETDGGVHKPGE